MSEESFPPPYRERDGSDVALQTEEEDDDDQFVRAMGKFGRWQCALFFILGLAMLPGTYPILVMTFMNARVDFWCGRPEHLSHLEQDDWKVLSGQRSEAAEQEGNADAGGEAGAAGSCRVLDLDYQAHSEEGLRLISSSGARLNGSLVPMRACSAWEYDRSMFGSTIAAEWDLVCSNEYLLSVGQTVYFLGMTLGVFLVGLLTDRFGRRPALLLVVALVSLFGAATSFTQSFEAFLAARFLTALGAIGVLVILTTFMMEIVGGHWTSVVGLGLEYFWALAWLTLGLLANFLRHWRHLLLVTSLPGLAIILLLMYFMPESPRWLMTVGRQEEAEKAVRKAATTNRRVLPKGWTLEVEKKPLSQLDEKVSCLEMFRHPQLRCKTLILYVNWFTNALVYYGLALNSGSLGGDDLFLSFMINGAMEIPAYTAAILLLVRCGRRLPYATALILAGLCLLSILLIPSGNPSCVMAVATLGKFFVTISFSSAYIYTSELFPTALRATGVGSSCFFSRLGGAAASWLALAASAARMDSLPPGVYGVLALACGISALALPETKGRKMPDTIAESEAVKMKGLREAFSLRS